MKKILNRIVLSLILILGLFVVVSCGKQENSSYESSDVVNPVTPSTDDTTKPEEPTIPVDDKPLEPKEPTDAEKRTILINKTNTAINSLSDKNFTARIGSDVYKIDGYNCEKAGVFYEANTDKYNVYTLKDATKQSYTKTETQDFSFRNINVGSWNNIFTIADQMELNRVDIVENAAYVVKNETAFPEFKIYFNDNGFILSNLNQYIEFYDIGSTEVTIPTNIAKEETYIIKDGKYDLATLKEVLTEWINGENKDNMNVFYDSASRNLVDITLINVKDGVLSFYAEAATKSGNVYHSHITFISKDVNKEIVKENLKLDDFKAVLYEQNSLSIDYDSVFKISKTSIKQMKTRTKNILAKDEINISVDDILFVYETEEISSNITYGDGLNYKTAFCLNDGRYFEYTVGALSTDEVYEDTQYWDIIRTKTETVLEENILLYNK